MRRHRLLRLCGAILIVLSATLSAAVVPARTAFAAAPVCGASIQNVSGTISTNTIWSPDKIYVLTGDVTVGASVTLLIQPGTVIKGSPNRSLYIDGTLTANGTVANPIYFTSLKDDSLCGDVNGDGSTTVPAVGDWGYIEFGAGSSDASSLSRAVLRYGGKGWNNTQGGAVRLLDAGPTLAYLSMEQNVRNAAQIAGTNWNTASLSSSTVVYWLGTDTNIQASQTLTVVPGAKIKGAAYASLYIYGKLIADGTLANPIFFTSEKDDTVCGIGAGDEPICDTNNAVDGPATQDWGYIEFQPGSNDTSSLTRAVLRYGGRGWNNTQGGVVRLLDAGPTLAYLSMEQNVRNAAQIAGTNWNTASLSSSTVVYWLGSDTNIQASQTLTVVPGAKIKGAAYASLYVYGKLIADGTPAAPIFFTSEKDDSVCGYGARDELICDTNNAVDGPAAQDWGYIEFQPGSNDTSSLTRAVLRYGGRGWNNTLSGPVRLKDAGPTLDYLSMEQNVRNAAEIAGTNWNTGALSSSTVVYWLGVDTNIQANQTLTIAPGVKIKAAAQANLFVYGKLTANGSPATDVQASVPITFTSEKDDTVCGIGASDELVCDTNNAVDGPAIRDWGYIEFQPGSNSASSLTHAVLRYGGYGWGGTLGGAVRLKGASPTISHVRFRESYIGLELISGALPALTCNDFVGNQAFGMRNDQPASVVSASGQWWGSASGPTYAGNPGGTGQKISDGINYSPWADAECAPPPPITTTKWLVLLYLAGDNQADGVASLSEPMRALLARLDGMAYNPNMRLVVLFDGDNTGSGDTRIYTYGPGGRVDVTEQAAQDWLGGMGGAPGAREIDSGQGASLSTFVNWATRAYPGATYTMLSVVDHGGGWAPTIGLPGQPRNSGGIQAGSWRGMNLDLSAPGGSSLSTRDLGIALRNMGHVDVLFLDACLMGMLETAYEVSDHADYLVSGENVLFANLPYDSYLSSAALTSSTSPLGLARQIVARYNDNASETQPFALSLVDLARIRQGVAGSVPVRLNKLAEKLLAALPAEPAASDPLVQAIVAAYSEAQKFDYDSSLELDAHEGYVDLVNFASNLRDSASIAVPADVRAAASDLVAAATSGAAKAIDTYRVVSGSYDGKAWDLSGARGLSIFLPLGERDYRPTQADPSDYSKPFQAERQLTYYANPNQLKLTHDAPLWAELLVRLEPTVSIIRTGPGGLPSQPTASLEAAITIDTRPFNVPGQVTAKLPPPDGQQQIYLPLVKR